MATFDVGMPKIMAITSAKITIKQPLAQYLLPNTLEILPPANIRAITSGRKFGNKICHSSGQQHQSR